MNLSDILALVKAGYTREEISAMNNTQTNDAQPVAEQVAVAVAEPAPVPTPAPTPADQPEQKEPTMSELMQSIAKLTSAVQANAIAQSVLPGGVTGTPKAEDMLAEIIRPTYKPREGM